MTKIVWLAVGEIMDVLKNSIQKQLAFAVLTLFSGMSTAVYADFVEIGHTVDYLQSAASSRFAEADLDSDGRDELIFIGNAASPVLMAVGKRADNTYGMKMAKLVPDDGYMTRVLAWHSPGVSHILTIATNGTVREYRGWPLVEQRTFNIASNVVAAEIGDINQDGTDDLVVATDGGLYTYSLANAQAQWSYPVSEIQDLGLAQLDADPALEIILAGPVPGLVLDGATQATDWQYIDGFGYRVAAGSLAAGGGTQWVGAQGWYLYSVFRASPWTPLWSGSASQDIGAIATANLDDNGRDVILLGDGQWGEVHVIDPTTQQDRFQVANPGHGMNAVAGIDFDADGKDEIAFAARTSSFQDPLLNVANSQSGLVEWNLAPTAGPYIATALGDVDGDGSMELVAAAKSLYSYGRVAVFDALTGLEEWHSPEVGNANEPFYIDVSNIHLVPHESTPGVDIVLAGNSIYDGRIVVLDGVTKAVRLQIGVYASGPMVSRNLKGSALVDYDNDGSLDYVAATQASTTGSSGALLQVFSGEDGSTLWTSVAMGGGFSAINDVLVMDVSTGSPNTQLVAVLPGSLRAYDVSTGFLSWTLAATNDGAFLVPNGESGAEIGVYLASGGLTFYSASTRAYLRSYSLPAPLRTVTALGGELDALLAASADALALVDGVSGNIISATDYLGPFPQQGSRLSATAGPSDSWMIAAGTETALFRFWLNQSDTIFADSFENP